MVTIIENAGAQKGVLILEKDGALFIEAAGYIEQEQIKILQSLPLPEAVCLPVSMVQYVARTGDLVVLQDAGLFRRTEVKILLTAAIRFL